MRISFAFTTILGAVSHIFHLLFADLRQPKLARFQFGTALECLNGLEFA